MTEPLCLAWRTFHAPKAGNTLSEYEDAVAGDPEQGRFAIADGASESAFAGEWARILVDAYVHWPGPWSTWLAPARADWQTKVRDRELPWYAEAKADEGAYAALLGIAFSSNRWRAAAVGDCCLFQVHGERIQRAFPMRRASDFSNRPSLLNSRPRHPGQSRARRLHVQGDMQSGDAMLMMTDSLAQWFLQQAEEGRQPWQDMLSLGTHDDFLTYVAKLREANALRNDDVTLGIILAPRD